MSFSLYFFFMDKGVNKQTNRLMVSELPIDTRNTMGVISSFSGLWDGERDEARGWHMGLWYPRSLGET